MSAAAPGWPLGRLAPEGTAARVVACFLATAGIFYVNIMPALIDALKVDAGLTNSAAGFVGAANMYGGALGSVLVALNARRVRWYGLASLLLPALIGADLASTLAREAAALMAVRFAHGMIGGALVGCGFLVIGRIAHPNRTFGLLILLQSGLAALGVYTLPLLVRAHGIAALYAMMVSFSLLTWGLIQWLPRYEAPAAGAPAAAGAPPPPRGRAARLAPLLAVTLFQMGNMALNAFLIGMGQAFGFAIAFISDSLGAANLAGMLGSLALALLPRRHGFLRPALAGMAVSLLGAAALLGGASATAWIAANVALAVAWSFILPLLFGLNAELDPGGRGSVWGGFMSKIGLASGPVIGALALGGEHYERLLAAALALIAASCAAAWLPARRADATRRA